MASADEAACDPEQIKREKYIEGTPAELKRLELEPLPCLATGGTSGQEPAKVVKCSVIAKATTKAEFDGDFPRGCSGPSRIPFKITGDYFDATMVVSFCTSELDRGRRHPTPDRARGWFAKL